MVVYMVLISILATSWFIPLRLWLSDRSPDALTSHGYNGAVCLLVSNGSWFVATLLNDGALVSALYLLVVQV